MTTEPTPSALRQRFEALALPHLDAAYNLARWLARDDHDASDIVKEAYLRAFEAFAGMRGDNARPWLLAIVRNTCFTWLGRNRRPERQVAFDENAHDVADAGADPALQAARCDEARRVDAAIERLPVEFREVVVLRELEELTYKEIAAVLDVPIGTVMSRLSRGRRLLAGELADGADGG